MCNVCSFKKYNLAPTKSLKYLVLVSLVPPVLLGCILAFQVNAASIENLVDTDGNGVISAAEFEAAREVAKAGMLSQYDTDGNGELSRSEREVMHDDRDAQKLATFDADSDGELSREERRAARTARHDAVQVQLDVNQDGELSDEELAGFEQVRESRKGKRGHGNKHDD